MNAISSILMMLGSIAMFLYGMTLMSSSLQKVNSGGLRRMISSMTTNPFREVMTGMGITAIIQSSSATTVMVVSFVNAGLLTLTQAVGFIMGANIGTTLTAWIIALFGFRANVSAFTIPFIALGFILMMSKSSKSKYFGQMILGLSLLFMGLSYMQKSVPDLSANPQAFAFIEHWTNWGFGSVMIFVLIGVIFTLIMQSSSATMAVTLIMVAMGWIPFSMATAMVLGENIGTTITANIAATVGNIYAKRAAVAHTFFNVFGVLLALALFKPLLKVVSQITMWMGFFDPMRPYSELQALDPAKAHETYLYASAIVHTLFNVTNTLILVWFIPQIVKFVCWVVPSRHEEEPMRLKYIQGGVLDTPELSLAQAKMEIVNFAVLMKRQYGYARSAIRESDSDKFDEYFEKLNHYEEVSDHIEYEIATYLNKVAENNLSETAGRRMQSMYKIIGELESVGDSGYNIGHIIQRMRSQGNVKFTTQMVERMMHMLDLLDDAFDAMATNCDLGYDRIQDISNAINCEQRINEYRDNLREEHLMNLENKAYSYLTGVYYMDIISECEKIGDFMINVSEAIIEIK
ncbi:MAG: Na/Pi cotransporter family protein [Bacteroidales bacterium]|jgi:phosphate:Na+ symporter|nr:Na/Pi cotransporter family protein [Bacteroidales bacterium]MCI2121167.1 Na/Pi cotransporter family protein [Bacteroidales bacterium]MCI2145045.1 Na/Pi cotransporter family protein [Bacteroidales bacterium]